MGENTVAENIREKYIRGRSKLQAENNTDKNVVTSTVSVHSIDRVPKWAWLKVAVMLWAVASVF